MSLKVNCFVTYLPLSAVNISNIYQQKIIQANKFEHLFIQNYLLKINKFLNKQNENKFCF